MLRRTGLRRFSARKFGRKIFWSEIGLAAITRIKNVDQSREERDFIFIENEHFCDANVAYPLSEIRRLAKLCCKVSILAASRFCFPPPPPEINVEQPGRGRGSIAAGVQATSLNIDFGGRGAKQEREASKMFTLRQKFARGRVSFSGPAIFASQKLSFSKK